MAKCGLKTEVYSRCCGYFRPVANWNKGKKEEFKERKMFRNTSGIPGTHRRTDLEDNEERTEELKAS